LARSLIQIVNTQATMTDCHAEQAIEAKWNGFDRQLSSRAFAILILIWLALGVLAVFVAREFVVAGCLARGPDYADIAHAASQPKLAVAVFALFRRSKARVSLD